MNQPRGPKATTIALYAIAALLLANLVAMALRSDAPTLVAPAMGQRQPPIAGGGGYFVMPAQLSGNSWGCYLIDVDRGTLCLYQYHPGSKQLQFLASRSFINDTKLSNYNTTPSPQEILDLVNKQGQGLRGLVPPGPSETERK